MKQILLLQEKRAKKQKPKHACFPVALHTCTQLTYMHAAHMQAAHSPPPSEAILVNYSVEAPLTQPKASVLQSSS